MGRKIPERYVWAIELLDVQPNDQILEVGCGYGHSIPLICERLRGGKLTAIDRSSKMADTSARMHASYVHEGKAEIVHADLLDLDEPAAKFDKIFLFNLNVFWMDPTSELIVIKRSLKPNGRFYIFHQPPPGHELNEFVNAFKKNLKSNDFRIERIFRNHQGSVGTLCIVSF